MYWTLLLPNLRLFFHEGNIWNLGRASIGEISPTSCLLVCVIISVKINFRIWENLFWANLVCFVFSQCFQIGEIWNLGSASAGRSSPTLSFRRIWTCSQDLRKVRCTVELCLEEFLPFITFNVWGLYITIPRSIQWRKERRLYSDALTLCRFMFV